MIRSLYEVLQVRPDADPEVIAAAFKALARRYHPDVNNDGDANRVMGEINHAYEVLSDPVTRAEYDRFLSTRQDTRPDAQPAPQKSEKQPDEAPDNGAQKKTDDQEMRDQSNEEFIALLKSTINENRLNTIHGDDLIEIYKRARSIDASSNNLDIELSKAIDTLLEEIKKRGLSPDVKSKEMPHHEDSSAAAKVNTSRSKIVGIAMIAGAVIFILIIGIVTGRLFNIIIGCVVGVVVYGIYSSFKKRTTPMGVFPSFVSNWILTGLVLFVITIVVAWLLKACSDMGTVGQNKAAVTETQEASQELTAESWVDKASALWVDGKFTDPNKAIEYLNNAIKLEPGYARAYNGRGLAYADLGQYQRATEDYNEAIRLKPDNYKIYYNRGFAYADLGQHQQAIENYNEAMRLKPGDAYAYSVRGDAYAALGQYQRATEDYNEAIRLKPDDAVNYSDRGRAYLSQGNKKLGCRDAKKACELGNCKALEWAKDKGLCQQEQDLKSREDEVKNPPADVSITKSPVKQSQPPPLEDVKPSVEADQPHKGIKGIVLMNGNVIEGQIISIDAETVKIRTKDGKILSYSFTKEVKTFIKDPD